MGAKSSKGHSLFKTVVLGRTELAGKLFKKIVWMTAAFLPGSLLWPLSPEELTMR